MRIIKIVFNNGVNEGYFIETKKGYVHVTFAEGQVVHLKNIKSKKEIRINEATLRVEEVKEQSYIG